MNENVSPFVKWQNYFLFFSMNSKLLWNAVIVPTQFPFQINQAFIHEVNFSEDKLRKFK